jgi:hypothetical protein
MPFWQAWKGGQLRTAEYLHSLGADLNGTPSWGADNAMTADMRACALIHEVVALRS